MGSVAAAPGASLLLFSLQDIWVSKNTLLTPPFYLEHRLDVLCEGLSRTRPGAEHLFFSLPSAKPSPPPFAPLGGPEPGGLCCRCHGLGRKESNPLCHVEMEHPMPTLHPFHPHPMPICSPWHPPSVSEGPTLQQCPRGVGAALSPSPAFPSQPFLKLFFFLLPPNTTKAPNPPQMRNLFLFLFSLCFLPRQSIDWS